MILARIRVPVVVVDGALSTPMPTADWIEGTLQGPKVGKLDARGQPQPIGLVDIAAGGYTVEVDVPADYLSPATGQLDPTYIRRLYRGGGLRQPAVDYLASR